MRRFDIQSVLIANYLQVFGPFSYRGRPLLIILGEQYHDIFCLVAENEFYVLVVVEQTLWLRLEQTLVWRVLA